MYSKNLVISLPNVPSNYITNSVAFSAQSLTHDNGKPIIVCEYCKKQRHTKDQCWKLHGRPPRGNKRSSNEQQNLRRTDVRETASTSQPIGPTASHTSSPTLSVIVQSGMSQSLGLISVDGTNLWILDSGATDHLTGFSEHFITYTSYASNEKIWIADGSSAPIARKGQIVLYDGFSLQNVLHVPKLSYNLLSISKITRELHCKATFLPESVCFQGLKSGRTIGTTRHSRGLYILNDDTSGSSISTTSLLSSYLSTSEHDFMLWHFRMSSRILHLQTPLECLKESYPSTPLVSEVPLRVFGCIAYVYSFGPNQTKFTPRAQACVFVGYPLTSVGESVSKESNSTFEFIEPTPSTVSDIDPHPISLPTNQVPWKTYYRRNLRKEVGSSTSQPPTPVQDFEPPRDQGMENPTEPCTNNTMSENNRSDAAVLENMEKKNRGDETEVRIETGNDEAEQSHTRKHDEYDPSLDLPTALRKDGTLDRHKARLVAKGFSQTYGVDYSETFSPVAKLNTVKVLLSVAVNKDWPLYQLDVKNAFSNGDLVEEVYMSPLLGFEAQFSQQVCKLQKSLYGLKQSPRAWFDRFTTFVKSQGYSQGHSYHTLFTKVPETGKIAVLIVYVDDIVLSGDDQAEISQLKQRKGNKFEIKDLGNLKYFLGMKVAKSKEGIFVSQRKDTLDLLTEIGVLGCHPADTPIEFNCKLENSDDQVPVDKEQYQRLVGKLIYLSHIRPDISFAVSAVSQFMQAPYEEHIEAVKRILRYLKTTPGKGLMFRKTDKMTVEAYTDSDWAGSVVD
ncbi:Cysteine-rich RLK (receptor-like protein kinase) 8 [Cucumis melo var. makuwa]|uniref:Cysteine-rich RLK (Receptor-like protein kinase) 8 n=1 Tax=Cucumis melo var. makuwa TaxID=1194695 RepID=A0A5D3DQY9_CUCMM|nr:Cysteine-rich RLK (receptor-like protein kinase) 8 [Cucumis melo var. makuwa]